MYSLDLERNALHRWMRRLKRACHSVERIEQRVVRFARQLASLEET